MAKITFDATTLKTMALFEEVTGARIKDFVPSDMIFIIEAGDMGRAIGKNASNVKRVEMLLKRPISLIEFSDNISQFIKNLVHPADVLSVENEEGNITIRPRDARSKGMIFGRDRSKLTLIKEVLKRHFAVKDVRVA
ncbi:MAG TPA: NusA-like transcription termination signal-binding factor [Candidatus Nanoarchaeia archaeon]|nr:NusA-like transcription termination signal-binding factor [Candidatus Nanoarchaeia archaeon]